MAARSPRPPRRQRTTPSSSRQAKRASKGKKDKRADSFTKVREFAARLGAPLGKFGLRAGKSLASMLVFLASSLGRAAPVLRRALRTAVKGIAPLRRFVDEGWGVVEKKVVRPFLRFAARRAQRLHRVVKKRYGKTKIYKKLVSAHKRFRTWPRPSRLAAYLGAAFLLWMISGQLPGFSGSDTRALIDAGPPSVRVYESVERVYLPALEFSGQTQASRQVVIRAETSGRIERTFFDIGQYVEAGDAVVAFDPATRPLELEEARTALRQAEIEYNAIGSLARGGYRSELRRLQALSAFNRARVVEDRIRRDLENAEPKAPFSGSLAALKVERGDFLSIGKEIARLIDLDPLSVRVAVSERDIAAVHLGAKVTGTLVTGESFGGKVGTIAPASNARTRTFEVEIVIANRNGRWREGLTAQVRLPIEMRKAHLIPAVLLSLDAAGDVGVKVVEQGIVRFRPVEVLGEEQEGLWVLGLENKDSVISVGHENVSEGMNVESVPDERFSKPVVETETPS